MREAIGGALTYSPFTLAWNGYEPVYGIVLRMVPPPFTLATIIGVSITHAATSLVSSPDPTYERGSGDIRLIPRASLTLITFWREIFFANHIAETQSAVQHWKSLAASA